MFLQKDRCVLLPVIVISLLLQGCSDKEPLKGIRENVLSLDNVGEFNEHIDEQPVILDAAILNHSYPQAYMNAYHCYYPLNFSMNSMRNLWTVGLDFEATKSIKITASPIVSDGKIFCADAGGIVYAFDAKTGSQLWRTSVTIEGKDGQSGMAMAYAGGHLIVTSCFYEAVYLNPKNGTVQWRIKLPASSKGDAITISDDRVFFMCSNSSLKVVDINSGKLLWSHSGIISESAYLGSAAVAVDGDIVYLAYPSGEIFALLVETGSVIWESVFPKFSVSNASRAFVHPKASPVVKDGIVYFVASNEQTIAFDAKTGNRLWIKDYGGVRTPIVSGNSIFVLNSGAELVCLNRFNGNIRWKSILSSDKRNNDYGLILIKDHILAVSSEGEILFVSVKNGKVIKRENTTESVSVNPIIADSTLYILSNDGNLSAYK
ncbi:MAG: PQQ-binding-like beta-propeller repeat protein [Alphaproteobacteria bacterium]|nr:PQQ-binding-like beta-propeller repeat protein [Alphaproteobacteria bacterium]